MYGKPITTVFRLFLLCAIASIPVFAADDAETTAPDDRRPAAMPIPQELAMLSDEMLRLVNEGRRPSSQEITAVNGLLLKHRSNLQRYDEPGKTQYFMLSAWNNYFAGDYPAAVQAIQAGLRSGPQNPDMRATYAAIALATGNYPLIGRLAAPASPPARRRDAEGHMETPEPATVGSGILNFDMQAFRPMSIGRKLTLTDTTLRGIGGTKLVPADFELLCMLVYRTVGNRQPTPQAAHDSHEDSGQAAPPEGDPGAAFGALMTTYAGSGKVGFIGVSLDDAAATYNAMRETSARGWFWPQMMAQQEGNRPLAELARFSIDAPAMAIVTKDGTIAYFGSPVGFIPRLLLARATSNYTPQLFVPIDPMDPNLRRARMAADPNAMRRRAADPNAPRTGRNDDASRTADDIQAQRLYETARSFLMGQRTTSLTAGSGIQLCRQILERYPHTEYAARARELLRDLPAEIKQRHNITNAEMGL